jgi:hypothetical protein
MGQEPLSQKLARIGHVTDRLAEEESSP